MTAAVLVVLLALGARRDVITLWLLVPIVGIIALSLLVQPTLQMHYLLGVIPAAAIVAARNRAALVAVLVAASLVGVWNWYERGVKDDWRAAAAWVTSEMQEGDGIVFDPNYLRRAYGFYASEPDPVWPAFDWSSPALLLDLSDYSRFDQANRIWLVEGHVPRQLNDVSQALADFEERDSRTFAGGQSIRVTLMVRTLVPSE